MKAKSEAKKAASQPARLSPGTPVSSQYLTYPDGSMKPCAYHKFGNIKAVVVTGTSPKAAGPGKQRNADDLAEEKYIRAQIKKGEFMPGIYKGGPVTYSTGNGLKTFSP